MNTWLDEIERQWQCPSAAVQEHSLFDVRETILRLCSEVRRLRDQAEQEHAAAAEALRLMDDRAREAGELRGMMCPDCAAAVRAWRSEDSPAYGQAPPERERLHTLVYEPKGDDCE